MANIVSKLNLNRTPNIVENNSMVFAKNIRIDVDGTIHRDYAINPLNIKKDITGNLDYYNSLGDRILSDLKDIENGIKYSNSTDKDKELATYFYGKLYDYLYLHHDKGNVALYYKIIDVIVDNTAFYLLINCIKKIIWEDEDDEGNITETVKYTEEQYIIKYNEKEDCFSPCNCNWSYHGGVITGKVINNLLGETILCICEKDGNVGNIPIKFINLNLSNYDDDESIYTQTPIIPLTNVLYSGVFNYSIPNGVYQFFVRYKIRDEFYTDWFPASRDLFAGNHNTTITSFGTVGYVNTHLDSTESFILKIEHLLKDNISLYESFQIGFILSHDDTTYARAWKHFDFNVDTINFDYKATDAEEIEVTDLTKPTYQIYDVGNIDTFKNKVYIANYKETEFNDGTLQNYANNVAIEIKSQSSEAGYGTNGNYKYNDKITNINGTTYITGFKYKEGGTDKEQDFAKTNGIIDNLLHNKFTTDKDNSIASVITNCCDEISLQTTGYNASTEYCEISGKVISNKLGSAQNNIKNNKIKIYQDRFVSLIFNDNDIKSVEINGNVLSLDTTISIAENIIRYVYNNVIYLDYDCNFVDKNCNPINNITINLYRNAQFTYTVSTPPVIKNNDTSVTSSVVDFTPITPSRPDYTTTQTTTITYAQTINITFHAYKNKLNIIDIEANTKYTTLLPYQKYRFYIHYVKATGEVTNGYPCNGVNAGIICEDNIISADCAYKYPDCDKIIYPVFSNIELPTGYVGCFFSIVHEAINTAVAFNVTYINNQYETTCLDINTGLFKTTTNIQVQNPNRIIVPEISLGTYYYSSDYKNSRYFGANGVVVIDNNIKYEDKFPTSKIYITENYNSAQTENTILIKCTPFITSTNYDDYTNLDLNGYLCKIYSLDRDKTIEYYTDGNDVNKKTIENTDIKLTQLSAYSDTGKPRIMDFNLTPTNAVSIYSNYNLNYLSLTEDVKQVIKTYYNCDSGSTPTDSFSKIFRLFSSLIMSEIYELKSMYKDYTRKTYSKYNTNSVITYNNTVRSSVLTGDESKASIFRFDADDYYNIPTNRGIITNLISVGDAILVHTQDSMFKFSGSNTLQSNLGEIQTSENEVFNTGVSEVFGSDFGFGGLQDKSNSIITENGYIYYDSDSRVIYMYSGNGQMSRLNDGIEKLFRYKPIEAIRFANDYYNNRFFVCIWFNNDHNNYIPVTLSFSLNEQRKTFISLHDFAYVDAFNTKANCYFFNTTYDNISTIDKTRFGEYYGLEINRDYKDYIYPSKVDKTNTRIFVNPLYDATKPETSENTPNISCTIASFSSIVDIIDNTNFEGIKTLNSLNWCSQYVQDEFPIVGLDDDTTYNMADENLTPYPADSIKLYTDTCATKELDLTKLSNNYSITNPDNYKYPRYNQGYWSLNYFRNINNADNKFKYLEQYDDGRTNAIYRSDENSLIEGKYFVARLTFSGNIDFKLETINFNYNNKL